MMEKQKSIIVLHQKKEKANGESADGLRNMGDIRKGSVCQNVTKLETGESIVAKGGKVRRERSIEKGEEAEKNIHPVTGALFTQEMLQSEFDYYMAQKLLEKLREAGLITKEELDKITAKNRQSFSPYLARIMP
ncbi:SHOCT domain-containing protein [[Clostridium] scindens]|jgi:hypothetical protein